MEYDVSGSKLAERLLSRPEGATMRELIAATGGPQYNVLKRLEAKGAAVTKTREGRETRYRVVQARPVYEMQVSDKGQVTLPKGLREEMRVFAGQTLEARVEGGKAVLAPKQLSVQDLFRMFPKPKVHLTDKQIRDARVERAIARFERTVGKRK